MNRFALKSALAALAILATAQIAHALTTVSALYPVTAPQSVVGSLPTCGAATKGAFFLVTDALTPVALSTVAGSGAVIVPVVCNGTNWIVS